MARNKPKQSSRSKSAKKEPREQPQRGRGRPSDFKPEYCEQAEKLCKLMRAEDADLAAFFDKDVATINRWKKAHPEFRASIKKGKVHADLAIAEKLHERGTGSEWIEEVPIKLKTVEYQDGKRVKEWEEVKIVFVTKRSPPDVTAQIFWLKNRQSEAWRDKQDHDHNVKVDVNLNEVRSGIASKLGRVADARSTPSVARKP